MTIGRLKRKLKVSAIVVSSLFVFLFFQNFTSIPLDRLKPQFAQALARPASPTDGTADIRKLAPPKPLYRADENPSIASPQSGHDLNSISQDWMTRQTHLITGGAEQRLLDDINKRMTRMITAEDEEPTEAPGPDVAKRDTVAKSKGGRGPASVPAQAAEEPRVNSPFKPTSLRLMSINRLQLGLASNTKVSCSFQGSTMRVDVSHPVSNTFDVNIRHETDKAKSSVFLNYSW